MRPAALGCGHENHRHRHRHPAHSHRKPIALDFPHHSLVVAHVRTDEGLTGLGYTLAFGGGGAESIQAYLETRLGRC